MIRCTTKRSLDLTTVTGRFSSPICCRRRKHFNILSAQHKRNSSVLRAWETRSLSGKSLASDRLRQPGGTFPMCNVGKEGLWGSLGLLLLMLVKTMDPKRAGAKGASALTGYSAQSQGVEHRESFSVVFLQREDGGG